LYENDLIETFFLKLGTRLTLFLEWVSNWYI